jgi:hypothetical protein
MPRSSPCYDILSVVAPFLGLLAFVIFLGAVDYTDPMHSPDWQTGVALILLGGAGLPGFILGCIAGQRSEKLWSLTNLGLVLNAPLLLVFLCGLAFLCGVRL